jgi:hypothetical protein
MEAAATQLEMTMRESQEPVAQISAAIRRMAATLATLRHMRDDGAAIHENTSFEAQLDASLTALLHDLSRCMEGLQFHDRMVQHLAQLRGFLADSAALERGSSGSKPEAAWNQLLRSLRQRLITDAQRELLDLVLPDESSSPEQNAVRPARSTEGSIELF